MSQNTDRAIDDLDMHAQFEPDLQTVNSSIFLETKSAGSISGGR